MRFLECIHPARYLFNFHLQLEIGATAHRGAFDTTFSLTLYFQPVKINPATPTTVEEIERCLARVRKKGFAVADPEVIIGLRVLAGPVLNIEGYSVAAVSAAAPAMNITLKKFVSKTAEAVMRAACELSKTLEASGTALPGSVAAI